MVCNKDYIIVYYYMKPTVYRSDQLHYLPLLDVGTLSVVNMSVGAGMSGTVVKSLMQLKMLERNYNYVAVDMVRMMKCFFIVDCKVLQLEESSYLVINCAINELYFYWYCKSIEGGESIA